MGPPTMIHTKDGSVYYGELVERVETKGDEHVTILLATGIPKRIALKDVDPSPVSLPIAPREEFVPPTVTVRTKDGSAYHGELVERVVGQHVILKIETGDTKTLEWDDLDFSPPAPVRTSPREPAPIENVRTKNGSVYHGEIIEKVVRDHVTLRLTTDEIKTLDWEDLAIEPAPRVMPEKHDPALDFRADDPHAVLERRSADTGRFELVCHTPCRDTVPGGTYRIGGDALVASRPFNVGARDTLVRASMAATTLKRAGMITSITSAPILLAGFIVMIASITAPSYSYEIGQYGYPEYTPHDNSGLGAANAILNLVGGVTLLAGLCMLGAAHSNVRVNGLSF